jgi:hypothetical protein
MAKVKPPFFVRIVAQYANGKEQCNSCKEWNTIRRNHPKEEKGAWKANRLLRAKPQSL